MKQNKLAALVKLRQWNNVFACITPFRLQAEQSCRRSCRIRKANKVDRNVGVLTYPHNCARSNPFVLNT
jgi:hypothetical protein